MGPLALGILLQTLFLGFIFTHAKAMCLHMPSPPWAEVKHSRRALPDPHDIRPVPCLSASKAWVLFTSWSFQRKGLLPLPYTSVFHEQWRVGEQKDHPSADEGQRKKKSATQPGQ